MDGTSDRSANQESKASWKTMRWAIFLAVCAFVMSPWFLPLLLKQIHPVVAERAALFGNAALITGKLAAVAGLIGLGVGLIVGTFGLGAKSRILSVASRAYVWLLCGTPLLVQILFFYYALPSLLPGWGLSEMQAGICALALNAGAYNSTAFKAGLDAVPKQQFEAGISLGLTRIQVLKWIILPQALRISVGPLLGNWVALLKDTSLVSAIGVAELTLTATRTNSETFLPVPTLITVALIYLGMSSMINIGTSLLRNG